MSASRLQTSLVSLVLALASGPSAAAAQSVMDRTPNLGGTWVGEAGVVQFNFLHRFELLDTDQNDTDDRIVNTPSFLLAVPLPERLLLGLHYASNSQVVPGESNEFELIGRWLPLASAEGAPLDAGITLAYNSTAESLDADLSLLLPVGERLQILGTGRFLNHYVGTDESRWAGGGGFVLRLHENVALAADALALTDLDEDEDVAWGAAIQTRIPLTPHSFSLQATNTRTATLQGSSLGQEQNFDDTVLWGFEFTIPFTLSRYFGDGPRGGEPVDARPATGDVAVEVTMTNTLRYASETVRIRRGQTVRWRNTSQLVHTVTADPSRALNPEESVRLPRGAVPFDSGDLAPGEVFQHTFDTPGEYRYFCIPHEAAGMVATVIVEG